MVAPYIEKGINERLVELLKNYSKRNKMAHVVKLGNLYQFDYISLIFLFFTGGVNLVHVLTPVLTISLLTPPVIGLIVYFKRYYFQSFYPFLP